jgi:hypothetical protein
MTNDIFGELAEKSREIPGEIGTEAVGQFQGGQKQASAQAQDPQQAAIAQQQYLQNLYGESPLTEEQKEQKEAQDKRRIAARYQEIQDSIRRYRAQEAEKVSKYEASQEEGTKSVETQEERQELWQEQQEEAKKKKEEQGKAAGSGSKQQMMGETAHTRKG